MYYIWSYSLHTSCTHSLHSILTVKKTKNQDSIFFHLSTFFFIYFSDERCPPVRQNNDKKHHDIAGDSNGDR